MRDGGPLALLLVIAAASPVILTIVDFGLAQGNHELQAEITERQQLIAQGAQQARTNEILVRQIAIASLANKDLRLRELLSHSGITINVSPVQAPAAPATPPAEPNR